MNPRFLFLGGVALLAFTSSASADTGPVTIVDLTNSAQTPAPPPATPPPAPVAPDAAPAAKPADNPAAPPDKKAPDPDPAPAPAPAAAAPAPAATTTPASPPAAKGTGSIFDKFISELTDAVKLSDDEKKEIESLYQGDGPTLQKLLDDPSISPLQQTEQVAELRNQRDEKIDTLLQDPARQHQFYEVEAKYRVALTQLAADGGLVPGAPAPTPPAATPPPAAAPPSPAAAK
jgi:hypothetical protein